MAMERIHGPLVGPRRADLRAGQIVAMLRNVNRAQSDSPVGPEDAALVFEQVHEATPEERRAMFLGEGE